MTEPDRKNEPRGGVFVSTEKACMTLVVLGLAMASGAAEGRVHPLHRLTSELRDNWPTRCTGRAGSPLPHDSEIGDWDLFLCRPDGSQPRNITQTPDYNDFAPQFSRDGRRLLYRRIPAERDN